VPPAPAFTFIAAQRDWDALAPALAREPRLGFDFESDGFHHYKEQLSLVQIASPAGCWILDPLAVRDVSALGDLLADQRIVKILHGSDYDLRTLDRAWRFRIRGLRDTGVATQLMHPEVMGLGRAIESYLGVVLPKQVRLQRSDWSRRPIPADALEYAVLDVAYLFALDDALSAKLESLGRSAWMAEECALMEGIRYEPPPPPEEAALEAKGTFDLSPEALSVYRELYLIREQSSERVDRPPFKVISNEALLAIARDPSIDPDKIPNANRRWLEAMRGEIRDAIRRGIAAGPSIHPSRLKRRPSPWTPEGRTRWQALNAVRGARAAELGIAPSTLWPTRSLEALCIDPAVFENEVAGTSGFNVRRWQREVFGAELREANAKAASPPTP
jgi:ribonuclease D